MRHRWWLRAMVAMLIGVNSAPLAAQSLFADGTLFANVERRDNLELAGLPANLHQPLVLDAVTTSPGGSLAFGRWLGSRLTLRLDTSWSDAERRVNRRGSLAPPDTIATSPDLSYSYEVTRRDRLWTWSALVAYHSRRWRRTQMAVVGGLAVVANRVLLEQRIDHPTVVTVHPGGLPPGTPTLIVTRYRDESSTTRRDYGLAPVVGLDADIAVAQHASLVPQVRVIGIRDGVGLRPGVALRARW